MFSSSSGPSASSARRQDRQRRVFIASRMNRTAQRSTAAHQETWRHGQTGLVLRSRQAQRGGCGAGNTPLFSIGCSEIARALARLGRSRQHVHSWIPASRGHPGMGRADHRDITGRDRTGRPGCRVGRRHRGASPVGSGTEDRRGGRRAAGRRGTNAQGRPPAHRAGAGPDGPGAQRGWRLRPDGPANPSQGGARCRSDRDPPGRSRLLYTVVHGEVEDAALDVAAALRTVRRGNGMLGRVRRLLVASRR